MAAIDLSAVAAFPYTYTKTTVGVTLQEFTLPKGARYATVKTLDASYVQFSGADGAAVTATGAGAVYPQGALAGERYDLDPAGDGHQTITICVAAQAATTTVYLVLEG